MDFSSSFDLCSFFVTSEKNSDVFRRKEKHMKYSLHVYIIKVFCPIIFFFSNQVYSRSITTLSGTDLNKAIIVTYEFVMTGSDYITGAIELKEGLIAGGYIAPAWPLIDISFPIHNKIEFHNFGSTPEMMTNSDLHLVGDDGNFLIDIHNTNAYLHPYYTTNNESTIFLDSDVTVSGNDYWLSLGDFNMNVHLIIDGQGHTIDFSHCLYGGVALSGKCTFKNLTLKNVWSIFDQTDPFADSIGNFRLSNFSTSVIFDNVTVIARKNKPFGFKLTNNFHSPSLIFKNNVRLINGSEFLAQTLHAANLASTSHIVITENSNLTIENSTFGVLPAYVYAGVSTYHPLNIIFANDSSQIILDNAIFLINGDNPAVFPGFFALDTTVTLSVGTIVVNGASSLIVDSLLARNGRASLYLGDGVTSNGDMNITINPGATLNLEAMNTNCSLALQNVH
jgi:hypothetical protein